MGAFDYECDGQISIFDILEPKKEEKEVDNTSKYKCLGKDCNHSVLTEVAHDLGYECQSDCCLKCSSRLCGARCNYSTNK